MKTTPSRLAFQRELWYCFRMSNFHKFHVLPDKDAHSSAATDAVFEGAAKVVLAGIFLCVVAAAIYAVVWLAGSAWHASY